MAGVSDPLLLSRVEDASINASAAPQQRWLDGWIVRTCPGKAKRARCINAVAQGRLPLDQRLALAAAMYAEAGLPMVVRLTRFSLPAGLDDELARRGWGTMDDTRVMLLGELARRDPPPAPPGTTWQLLGPEAYAQAVGGLRASPPEQRAAHAQRLATSPTPYRGHALVRSDDGAVLCCGQYAREAELAGLYDIHTREDQRGKGLARMLCEYLLCLAGSEDATVAYLQVEADNAPARHLYGTLGFAEGYAYHYRTAPPPARAGARPALSA